MDGGVGSGRGFQRCGEDRSERSRWGSGGEPEGALRQQLEVGREGGTCRLDDRSFYPANDIWS